MVLSGDYSWCIQTGRTCPIFEGATTHTCALSNLRGCWPILSGGLCNGSGGVSDDQNYHHCGNVRSCGQLGWSVERDSRRGTESPSDQTCPTCLSWSTLRPLYAVWGTLSSEVPQSVLMLFPVRCIRTLRRNRILGRLHLYRLAVAASRAYRASKQPFAWDVSGGERDYFIVDSLMSYRWGADVTSPQ